MQQLEWHSTTIIHLFRALSEVVVRDLSPQEAPSGRIVGPTQSLSYAVPALRCRARGAAERPAHPTQPLREQTRLSRATLLL